MLAPHKGRVYDPCYGSPWMFVQSEEFVEVSGGCRCCDNFVLRHWNLRKASVGSRQKWKVTLNSLAASQSRKFLVMFWSDRIIRLSDFC